MLTQPEIKVQECQKLDKREREKEGGREGEKEGGREGERKREQSELTGGLCPVKWQDPHALMLYMDACNTNTCVEFHAPS